MNIENMKIISIDDNKTKSANYIEELCKNS